MTDQAKARPRSAARRYPVRRKHVEDLLDQALADTFPASDPVAVAQPAPEVPPADAPDDEPRGEDEPQ